MWDEAGISVRYCARTILVVRITILVSGIQCSLLVQFSRLLVQQFPPKSYNPFAAASCKMATWSLRPLAPPCADRGSPRKRHVWELLGHIPTPCHRRALIAQLTLSYVVLLAFNVRVSKTWRWDRVLTSTVFLTYHHICQQAFPSHGRAPQNHLTPTSLYSEHQAPLYPLSAVSSATPIMPLR